MITITLDRFSTSLHSSFSVEETEDGKWGQLRNLPDLNLENRDMFC